MAESTCRSRSVLGRSGRRIARRDGMWERSAKPTTLRLKRSSSTARYTQPELVAR